MAQNELFFEDVTEGKEIKPLFKKASNVQIFMYQAATWNCDRIHYDYKFAREVFGLPDVVQTGPMSADWYAQMVSEWMGGTGFIKKLSYQSRVSIVPGDTLVCSGKVTSIYIKNGYHCVDCDLSMVNQRGENCSPGKATLILPLRGQDLDPIKFGNDINLFRATDQMPKRVAGPLVTEEVLKLIGFKMEPVVSDPITAKEMRRYALAIGDPNPIFHDEEKAKKSRYCGLIAPPCFALWACHPVSQDDFPENLTPGGYPRRHADLFTSKLPLKNLLHGGDEHELFHPIRSGDVLKSSMKIVDIYEKIAKKRPMIFMVREITVANQNEDLVDIVKITVIFH